MELIATGDTLDIGRQAINNWYSGTTFMMTGGTGANSVRLLNGNSTAAGDFSFILGKGNTNSAGAYVLISNGSGNTAAGTFSLVLNGKFNNVQGTYSNILNGISNSISNTGSRSTILNGKNNNITSTYSLIGAGAGNTTSSNFATIVGGINNQAKYLFSFIGNGYLGTTNNSSLFQTILNGSRNTVNAPFSAIINGLSNTNNGTYSTIINGRQNTITGNYSTLIGKSLTISSTHNYNLLIGKNISSTGSYQVVMGVAAGNPTIKFDFGSGNGYFDGGADIGNADYAEYFEWADGNPNAEKRYGYAVSLDNNGKIIIGGNNIIGIVSSAPGIIGDSAELSWSKKYEVDNWGIPYTEEYSNFYSEELKYRVYFDNQGQFFSDIPRTSKEKADLQIPSIKIPEGTKIEQVVVNKFNSEYNPKTPYIPRSKRKEWATIGLLGKLRIRTKENITTSKIDITADGMAINGNTYPVLSNIKSFDGDYGIVQIFYK